MCLLLSILQRGHGARVTCTKALQGLPIAPAHGPGVSDLCPQCFCQPPTSKAGPGHCVCLLCWSPPNICILRPFMLPPIPRLAAVFQLCSPRSLPPAPRLWGSGVGSTRHVHPLDMSRAIFLKKPIPKVLWVLDPALPLCAKSTPTHSVLS